MNNVSLIGRLTREAEGSQTNNGKSVCKFTLAVNRKFKNNECDFFNIVAWDKTAEFCSNYFKKGQQVAIVGSIQNRNWTDKEGKKCYITEIIANEVYFADSKKGSIDINNVSTPVQNDEDLPF